MITMASQKKSNKFFIWFVSIFAIFFGMYFFWLLSGSEFRGLPYVADLSYLEEEFKKIPPPEGATLSGQIKVLPKTTLHVVSANFDASLPVALVAKHYQETLGQNGWKQVSVMKDSNNIKRVEFCKKDIDAIVEFVISEENFSRYYFGIRWDGGRLSRTGCGQ